MVVGYANAPVDHLTGRGKADDVGAGFADDLQVIDNRQFHRRVISALESRKLGKTRPVGVRQREPRIGAADVSDQEVGARHRLPVAVKTPCSHKPARPASVAMPLIREGSALRAALAAAAARQGRAECSHGIHSGCRVRAIFKKFYYFFGFFRDYLWILLL